MYWRSAIALFLGLAAALPTAPGPDDGLDPRANPPVRIVSVGLLGSGCPAGTASVKFFPPDIFEAHFKKFTVKTGPNTRPSDAIKCCKLTINLQFDKGLSFSILKTVTSGFADIPRGSNGQCDNTFFFTGQSQQVTFHHPIPQPPKTTPFRGLFNFESDPGILACSPRGTTTAILNMNTCCKITPFGPTRNKALIDVDTITGDLVVKFFIRHC